jgi:protein TonB
VVPRIAAPNLLLPWHSQDGEDRRFWRILGWCLVPFLLLSIVIPLIDTPEPAREELEKLPPQLARVVLEEKELPKPPPPVEEPKEEEPPPEEAKPEPAPEPKPADVVQQAREKAQKSGVLKFADDLAAMRDSIDVDEVSAAKTTRSQGEAAQVDRSLVAGKASATSGGVDTSRLSRDTGGQALAGRETTQVENKLAQADGAAEEAAVADSTQEQAARSSEAIRKIMDRNKSAIFAIYHRALRKDPTLEGRVVVKIVIEPSGAVSSAEIVSSDLNDQDLESKILMRIRLIDFGAEAVETTTLNYTFDFLPS